MSNGAPDQTMLEPLGKLTQDAQDLVTLLRRDLSRARPWQRQLAAHLADVDRQLQVLRITVSLEKPDHEILAAADNLAGICRLAGAALAGSRIDPTTRAAVQLIRELVVRMREAILEARE